MLRKLSNKLCRIWRNRLLRKRLKAQDFSVISSNCNGALILHDLNQPFRSPFVNLYLEPKDFLRFLQNIPFYRHAELQFVENERYPLAKLADITLHFVHYHSEQEAREKWQSRLTRLNLDNLFIMMTDRDGCTYADLQAFEQLPFKHKVVFTHKAYPELPSAFYIKGFEQQGCVGDLFAFSGWFGQKYYDQFDYVSWLNTHSHSR